jgi:hypothetical protein
MKMDRNRDKEGGELAEENYRNYDRRKLSHACTKHVTMGCDHKIITRRIQKQLVQRDSDLACAHAKIISGSPHFRAPTAG